MSDSLKKNIVASYLSQFYVVFSGIVVLPFYIKWLGAESYGLIGFFAMLQAIFSLLDLGLTPTISRETSRYNAGNLPHLTFVAIYRTMAVFFILISFCGGLLLFFLSEVIANHWLDLKELDEKDVIFSIQVMSICISLRWLTGLYRGVIQGFELIVWMSKFNLIISTLRFLAVFPVMWFFGSNVKVFFIHQLVIAIVEFIFLYIETRKKLPKINIDSTFRLRWYLNVIKPYIPFSLSIALTSSLWIIVTQSDKLLMSKLLSLDEYGYFTLAVLVSNGIMMLSSPLSLALMPRLAFLAAANQKEELSKLYSNSTRMISIISGCTGLMFFWFSHQIMYIWTGDIKLANNTSELLKYYAGGYAFLSLSAFPYYLQYALGNMKFHIYGTVFYLLLLIPSMLVLVNYYGSLGAGYAWFYVNLIYLIFWTAIVHRYLAKGTHLIWFCRDIIFVLLPSFMIIYFFHSLLQFDGRLQNFFYLAFLFILIVSISSYFAKNTDLFFGKVFGKI